MNVETIADGVITLARRTGFLRNEGVAALELCEASKGDLRGIAKAIHLSRAAMRNIRENLFFAFLYNVLGIPLAAGMLYPFLGLLLSPAITNALRLRRARL